MATRWFCSLSAVVLQLVLLRLAGRPRSRVTSEKTARMKNDKVTTTKVTKHRPAGNSNACSEQRRDLGCANPGLPRGRAGVRFSQPQPARRCLPGIP